LLSFKKNFIFDISNKNEKMKIIYSIIILSGILLSACRKNKMQVTLQYMTFYAKQIGRFGVENFVYDGQRKLTSIVYTSNNEAITKSYTMTMVRYTANGNIEEILQDYTDPVDPDIKILRFYDATGKLDSFARNTITTGAYLSGGKYINSNNFSLYRGYGAGNVYNGKFEYQYTADGKNVVQQKSYNQIGVQTQEVNYTFNDKRMPQSLLPLGVSGFPINQNCIATQILISLPAGTSTTATSTNESNTDGFVTKIIFNGNTADATNYEYLKK
jgi:hypothetical protein